MMLRNYDAVAAANGGAGKAGTFVGTFRLLLVMSTVRTHGDEGRTQIVSANAAARESE